MKRNSKLSSKKVELSFLKVFKFNILLKNLRNETINDLLLTNGLMRGKATGHQNNCQLDSFFSANMQEA